jgi:site-specific DNA-cytosine methylase
LSVVDLFAGPGGWDLGARQVGLEPVGLELDAVACATRAAAGLLTLRADVTRYPPEAFAGVEGLLASPPCPDFSQAGNRAGIDGDTGRLMWEVPRWVEALRPRWVACEQVPPALPWWERFGRDLERLGYRWWAGVLNAADFGTVEACPLHAIDSPTGPAGSAEQLSRCETALASAEALATTWPDVEWASPAVSVAQDLVKAIDRVSVGAATCEERQRVLRAQRVSEGPPTRTGGEVGMWTTEAMSAFELLPDTAESIAWLLSGSLADHSLVPRWSIMSTKTRRTITQRISRCIAATLITGPHTGPASRSAGCGLCVDIATPQTRVRAFLLAHRDRQPLPPEPTHAQYPHPTMFGNTLRPWVSMAEALGMPEVTWGWERPSDGTSRRVSSANPALTVCTHRQVRWGWREGGAQRLIDAEEAWVYLRPATTVACDDRIAKPGHHSWGNGRVNGEGVKVELPELGILQAFPADYPWQGNKSEVAQQIGNSVPVLLAQRILEALVRD